MQIEHVDPRCDPRWQALIEQYPSSVFHTPAWITALTDTYGFEVGAYLLTDAAGAPAAGLAFCTIHDVLGQRIVALPFSDYCDPLVSGPEQWALLSEQLMAAQQPVAVRCLRACEPLADARFALVKRAKWHGVDLAPDADSLWQRLHKSSRWAIHKAQQDGVVVRPARGEDELRAFFDLHVRLRKYKHHQLAQPYSFFENIWRQFMDRGCGVLLIAIYRDAVIGGVLFLEWKGTLYYKFNASDPAYLAHQPNDFVTWAGIQYGKQRGCTQLDFGLTDWEHEGLARYKSKFATDEAIISYLRHLPASAPSQHEQRMRDLLGRITDLFVDASVPDHVTRQAGHELYRFFA
jgi:CelD/BcsL family acetyltransferase involved in cellulose biosynthesis